MSEKVPGDAATMVETGKHLTTLSKAFERAGDGFKAINTGGWYGDAADGFHHYLDVAAPKWLRSADAFESAGKAVAEYAATLEAAQQRAKHAQAELEAAQQRSNAAREQHNAAVEQATAQNGPPPPPFTDPAADDIAAARDAIARAEADVQAAGDRAARAVLAAAKEAPAEPGMMSKLKQAADSHLDMVTNVAGNVAAGVVTGLDSMAQGLRMVNPLDPYALTHPVGYGENLATMGQGIAHAATHPTQAFKSAVNWNMWSNNPAKALGTLIPSVVGTFAGGAGIAGKAAGVAGKISKVSTTAGKVAGKVAEKVPGAGKVDASGGRPPGPGGLPGGQPPVGHGPGPQRGGMGSHPGGPPAPGTPWGNSDLPPAPSHSGMPSHAPDAGRPDVAEPPQNYSGGGAHHMPWEMGDDGLPDGYHRDPIAEQNQPWRPSDGGGTPLNGDRPLEFPSEHQPVGPEARPEAHDVAGPSGQADLPGQAPGPEFDEAQRHVTAHGDPIGFGEHPWDFEAQTEDLPNGLTREPVGSYTDASDEFIYRDLDPADNPLYRKIQGANLQDLFDNGVSANGPDEQATLSKLGAHMGNVNAPSPFISTSDSLGHVLARDGGFNDGVVLDIRDPGGHAIDADATFRNIEGDRFISHGEGEKAYLRQIPTEHIRGGWEIVDGRPRWFANPNFDHTVMTGSR